MCSLQVCCLYTIPQIHTQTNMYNQCILPIEGSWVSDSAKEKSSSAVADAAVAFALVRTFCAGCVAHFVFWLATFLLLLSLEESQDCCCCSMLLLSFYTLSHCKEAWSTWKLLLLLYTQHCMPHRLPATPTCSQEGLLFTTQKHTHTHTDTFGLAHIGISANCWSTFPNKFPSAPSNLLGNLNSFTCPCDTTKCAIVCVPVYLCVCVCVCN